MGFLSDGEQTSSSLLQAGVRSLANVMVVNPTGPGVVYSATHIPGHTAAKAALLKEEAYVQR